ncbi:MAG: hypothetical protein MAG551_01931 [Candidatus Scalindua arabica]|uniref:Uncharacterized protein n=1 Tax=Candidatus Scalindua arabica TaxID=1127984 RepID=A0A941W3T1_9BACT|nr:hypothetical protein [Candidatus Scalindua arabica]
MEKDEFIKQLENDIKSPEFGSKPNDHLMWYNKEGDCIHFKTMDVDIIGKRIDEFLTLYISIEEQKPIGFQLKDIHALTRLLDADIMVETDVTTSDKRLVSINMLILKAFAKRPPNINRVSGYTDAVGVITKDEYNSVEIPVS